jgi:hypothetical protein
MAIGWKTRKTPIAERYNPIEHSFVHVLATDQECFIAGAGRLPGSDRRLFYSDDEVSFYFFAKPEDVGEGAYVVRVTGASMDGRSVIGVKGSVLGPNVERVIRNLSGHFSSRNASRPNEPINPKVKFSDLTIEWRSCS